MRVPWARVPRARSTSDWAGANRAVPVEVVDESPDSRSTSSAYYNAFSSTATIILLVPCYVAHKPTMLRTHRRVQTSVVTSPVSALHALRPTVYIVSLQPACPAIRPPRVPWPRPAVLVLLEAHGGCSGFSSHQKNTRTVAPNAPLTRSTEACRGKSSRVPAKPHSTRMFVQVTGRTISSARCTTHRAIVQQRPLISTLARHTHLSPSRPRRQGARTLAKWVSCPSHRPSR